MPKRVDHEERRRQIADALLRTAATRGLHATGMREVAAEAGVSLRLVQYYFGTKEELLLFAMQQLAELVKVIEKCGWTANVLNADKPVASVFEGIAVARKDYIEAVRAYNVALRTFPSVIWASTFFSGNKPMAEFNATDEAQAVPKVKF